MAKETQYRTLIENLPQKVFLKNRNSVYISCNENMAKDLKIKPEEVAGKTDYDFFPAHLAEKYRLDDKRVMDSGRTENIEEEFVVMKDFLRGVQKTIVNTVKVPVRDRDGSVTGVFGLFWDITERKKTERALIESEEKFRAIFNNAGEGIVLADPKSKKIYDANNAICQKLGYDIEEIKKMKVMDLHPEKEVPRVMKQFEKQAGGDFQMAGNLPVKRKDKSVFFVDINATKVSISGNTYLLGFFHDITERYKAEEKLRQAEELRTATEVRTKFTSMVSHELRSPLKGMTTWRM
jgi:PAS domain S-box-containing protein